MVILKRLLLAMLVLGALTATAWAQQATKAGIVHSAHDLTWTAHTGTIATYTKGGVTAPVTTNLCYFCHIAHKTADVASSAPGYLLWNKTLSSTPTYGVYSSDSFTAVLAAATAAPPTDLGASNSVTSATTSNLCLSCHDGTVAMNSFYENVGGLPGVALGYTTKMFPYNGLEIKDLTKQHPVHFQYTTNLANAAAMKTPANANSVDGAGAVPLYGGNYMLECTTCHDPHNGASVGNGSTMPFARQFFFTYAASGGMCTYCHT